MFAAILKYGWENVRHYLLCDGLDKETAHIVEALLIRQWETYKKGKGYNTVVPLVELPDSFTMPEVTKIKVVDLWDEPIEVRRGRRLRSQPASSFNRKPVRAIETGETYPSIKCAARCMDVSMGTLSRALKNPNLTCGRYWTIDDEEGYRYTAPLHWEFIDEYIEPEEPDYDEDDEFFEDEID